MLSSKTTEPWHVGTAFALLRDGAAPQALPAYIDDADNVRATLAAVRDEYMSQRDAEAALAAALQAEEDGEVGPSLIALFLEGCPEHLVALQAGEDGEVGPSLIALLLEG